MPRSKNEQTPPAISPEKVRRIVALLDEHYPEVACSLHFKNPLELLIATILAAQCTDERVNQVTPSLFEKYPTAKAFADAPLEELELHIKSTGFYHNKAKSIQACCRMLCERFNGEVPADLDTLVQLPGVGRKTANVILGSAYDIPGIIVDTHVKRVSQRLGLTRNGDPDKIERDLMALIEPARWVRFSHQLVQHGRSICQARKPRCGTCPLQACCDYFANSSGLSPT